MNLTAVTGVPSTVTTDRVTLFESNLFSELINYLVPASSAQLHIIHKLTVRSSVFTAYWKQLSLQIAHLKKWTEALPLEHLDIQTAIKINFNTFLKCLVNFYLPLRIPNSQYWKAKLSIYVLIYIRLVSRPILTPLT